MTRIPRQTLSFGLSSQTRYVLHYKSRGQQCKILGAGLCELPSSEHLSLSSMSLEVCWHFLWVPCYRTEPTNRSALFFCSFSPCRRKARSPSGCVSGLLGPFCCLFSTPLSWHGVFVCVCQVHMTCASELWVGR